VARERRAPGEVSVFTCHQREALGAERVERAHSWWILRDPAGLRFCVVPEPAGSLNDSNAQRCD